MPYCDPAVLPQFLAEINETVAWVYGAGEQASLAEYEQRMNKFKDIGEKIRKRYRFHEALPHTRATYETLMRKVEEKLASADEITNENRDRIINMC